MATEVNLTTFGNKIAGFVHDLKSDAYDKLNDLERYLHSATVYNDLPSDFFADVTDITFEGIDKATDIIENVVLETVPTRDLMPDSGEMDTGHTFISPALDNMEANLISLGQSAGTDNIKDISAAFLSDSDISAIENAYYTYKQNALNMEISLLNRYSTANMQGNIDWVILRNGYALNDFQKLFYSQLFELAQETMEWVNRQAINIEELHADFTASYNSLLNKLVSANIAAYKGEVQANVISLQNEIIKTDALVDVNKMRATQQSSELELKVRQETSRISSYSKHYAEAMRATLNNLDINVGVSKGVAGSYKAMLAAHSQRYSGIVLGRQ